MEKINTKYPEASCEPHRLVGDEINSYEIDEMYEYKYHYFKPRENDKAD